MKINVDPQTKPQTFFNFNDVVCYFVWGEVLDILDIINKHAEKDPISVK
jgi:hypothetical protein